MSESVKLSRDDKAARAAIVLASREGNDSVTPAKLFTRKRTSEPQKQSIDVLVKKKKEQVVLEEEGSNATYTEKLLLQKEKKKRLFFCNAYQPHSHKQLLPIWLDMVHLSSTIIIFQRKKIRQPTTCLQCKKL